MDEKNVIRGGQYSITVAGGMQVPIRIEKVGLKTMYMIGVPVFEKATVALMEGIRDKAVSGMGEMRELGSKESRDAFRGDVERIVKSEVRGADDRTKAEMTNTICSEATGLGPIDWLLFDPNLEEIVVNGPNEGIRVYHRKFGWLESNVRLPKAASIENYSKKIGRDVGRDISMLNPLLDARLSTGDRANAILPPISDNGPNITIRKFATEPWVFTDFINNGTANYDVLALVWLAIQYEMNMVVSGGTASGKTSFLNICMPFIPPNHRIVSIEDTRELQLPSFLYWTPLSTRLPNAEGKGEIDMQDLLVNSLRMRPDRIVVGEIRRKEQAEILFEAMHTGHSVYSTLHADTCNQTYRRLTQEPISIPESMVDSVHLNVVMIRDRRRGIRRIYEVGEFLVRDLEQSTSYDVNIMHRWSPRTDEIVPNQESVRLFEEISRHTAMTDREISDDLEEKKAVLRWAVDKKLDDLEKVGELMNRYYLDHDALVAQVASGK